MIARTQPNTFSFVILLTILLPILSQSACVSRSVSVEKPPAPSYRAGELYTVIRCSVYDDTHKLLYSRYIDTICEFLEDGSVIASDGKSLKRVAPDQTVTWEKPMHVHHIIRRTHDGNLLILSSELHPREGGMRRFDAVLKIDPQTGRELARFSFYQHFLQLRKMRGSMWTYINHDPWFKDAINVDGELTHANSVYEIGPNAIETRIPAFKRGNLIVNANVLNSMFILDPTMTQIMWLSTYQGDDVYRLHDVQVLPSGHLLVYNNTANGPQRKYSSLDEFDVTKKKVVWRYQPKPRSKFISPSVGSVQKLKNGNYLYSDITNGGEVVEVTATGTEISRMPNPDVDETTRRPYEMQEVKRYDLKSFFDHLKMPQVQ